MDADRFDAVIRALPNGGSRRHVLATALGGFLGVFGMLGAEAPGVSAAKSCKGLKGKKKKKCLEKAKASGCRKDADCRDQIESCQSGRCQRVCPNGACPGCALCLIRYEADGDRTRRCAGSAEIPALLTSCTTDRDCPDEAPLCISFNELSCTQAPCGTCAVSIGSCDEPECQNDGDCADIAESCQGGECRPVCPSGSCPGCNFCFVHHEADGDRARLCADSAGSFGAVDCSTDADCPTAEPTCIVVSSVLCAQPPCRQCFTVNVCTP